MNTSFYGVRANRGLRHIAMYSVATYLLIYMTSPSPPPPSPLPEYEPFIIYDMIVRSQRSQDESNKK